MLSAARQAWRSVTRRKGLAAAAILTLALGTGAATLLFTVIDAVLVRPLPYPGADRLVMLFERNPVDGNDRYEVSYRNFLDWKGSLRSLESLAGYGHSQQILTGGGEPVRLDIALASKDLFPLLGVTPIAGRLYGAEDDRPGAAPVVLVSEALWRGRFGSDPGIVGRPLVLDGQTWTIAGVLPVSFRFPDASTQVWLPMGVFGDAPWMANRSVHIVSPVARLAPGVTLQQAVSELALVMESVHRGHPGEDQGHGTAIAFLKDQVVQSSRPALLVLGLSAGLLVLIACANVAGLLLARGTHRQAEMALRAALGAGRRRLILQSLAESGILGVCGGALGAAWAAWALGPILARLPMALPRQSDISLNPRVLLFCLAASIATGLLAGLAPAAQASRTDPARLLAQGRRATSPAMRHWGRFFVAGQIALTMVLLMGAGVATRSLSRLLQVDPGFQSDRLLTLSVTMPASGDRARMPDVFARLAADLAALPGVTSATAVNILPISGGEPNGALTLEDHPLPPDRTPEATFRRVLPGYFSTMEIPLAAGRDFDERDGRRGEMVVIVSESIARRFGPGVDPIGRRIKVGPADSTEWMTIVGVVRDVRNLGLVSEPELATYEPLAQRPRGAMTMVVRASGDPGALSAAATAAVHAIEKDALVDRVQSMEERIGTSVAPARWSARLLAGFAASALALAALGLYALVSFTVSLRTREFGVRAAMGARRGQLVRMVLGQGLRLSLIGAAAGLAAGFMSIRILRSMLSGIGSADAASCVAPCVVLLTVTLAACWFPARRAAGIDPMNALRED